MSVTGLSQLQFAQVGCGLIGRKRVHALGHRVGLRYACDVDAARAAEVAALAPGCRAVTDLRTVLADSAVDAVVISTINASLASLALEAVRAGKHVLLEKPDATLRTQVEAALRARDVRLMGIVSHYPGGAGSLGDQGVDATLAQVTPETVFAGAYRRKFDGDPPPELRAAFHELIETVGQEVAQ